LKESSEGSVYKQPKVIFEKPEKQHKNKLYLNDFVQNVTSKKDSGMKVTMHSNSPLKLRKKALSRNWRDIPKQREPT
jgi:hypothetical protein